MARRTAIRTVLGVGVLALATTAPGFGCADDDRGVLMLAVTTDMRAPKDVNVVSVAVLSDNQLKYNFLGRVTPEGDVLLPATLAIVEDNPNAALRIRVTAFHDTKPRVLRDMVTTPPRSGRVALLRLPISFLNDGSATGTLPSELVPAPRPASLGSSLFPTDLGPRAGFYDPFGLEILSSCPDPTQTVIDGACADARVDSATLPDFSPNLVFGDQPGACFDCTKCFKGWRELTVNLDECVADKGGVVTNVGLLTANTGACDEKGNCYVPIDRAGDGWREEGASSVRLPKGVCKKVREGSKLVAIGNIDGCSSKTPSLPVCTGPTNAPRPVVDGGVVDGGGSIGGEKVVAANFASGVAVLADRLYFGARDGIFVVPNGGAAGQRVAGSPNGPIQAPWHVAQYETNVGFAIGTTIERANDVMGYVLSGTTTPTLAPITFPTPVGGRLHGVSLSSNQAYWAASGVVTGEGDVMVSGVSGAAAPGLAQPRQVTAVSHVSTGDLFVGDATGAMDLCTAPSGSYLCNTAVPLQPIQGPIEGIATAEELPTQAFVLRSDGIFLATKAAPLTVTRLVTADLLGITDGRYHPRGIGALPKCGFFTSARGLEYVTVDGTTALLAATRGIPALGIAVPGTSDPFVYFTVRAAAEDDGGIYRVRVPSSCL